MSIKYLFIVSASVFFLSFSCNSKNEISKKVNNLINPDRFITSSELSDLKKDGKNIIPSLISAIDKNEIGIFGNSNPQESDLRLDFAYVGVRAAYMIEFMIYDTSIERLYPRRVIVRKNMDDIGPEFFHLTYEDMKRIKEIYTSWWEANKNKSLSDIQVDFRKNRILDNSDYFWK